MIKDKFLNKQISADNAQEILKKLQFNEQGLIPAIAQDCNTGRVLMLAWMNQESIIKTIETNLATYFSRSRQNLWQKGLTSGNSQKIVNIFADCDYDCILLSVEQEGCACHTGSENCFFNKIL